MLGMVSYPRRPQSGHITCYLNRTYHVLPTPRILTVEQFRLLVSHLREPFNTLALMCVCFGLRISEALALKWVDVDWLNGTLRVERGIVQQIVDDVKTDDSRKTLTIAADLLHIIKGWNQTTRFSAPEDWIFASPFQLGRFAVPDHPDLASEANLGTASDTRMTRPTPRKRTIQVRLIAVKTALPRTSFFANDEVLIAGQN
jgi:integrase